MGLFETKFKIDPATLKQVQSIAEGKMFQRSLALLAFSTVLFATGKALDTVKPLTSVFEALMLQVDKGNVNFKTFQKLEGLDTLADFSESLIEAGLLPEQAHDIVNKVQAGTAWAKLVNKAWAKYNS